MQRVALIIFSLQAFQVYADQCVFGPTIINSKNTTFGAISSNSEGTTYRRNAFCSWKFELDRAEVLRLLLIKYSLHKFDVFNVRHSEDPSLLFWRWGGFGYGLQVDDLGPACISGSVPTAVDFETTSFPPGLGFTLEYEIVKSSSVGAFEGCKRTVVDDPWLCSEETIITSSNSTSGSVSSNSAGLDYLNNHRCSWKFELADDEVLRLNSSSFDLGGAHDAVNVQSNTFPPTFLFRWGGFEGEDPQENELACISGSIDTRIDFDIGPFGHGPGFTLEYDIVKSNAADAFDGCTRRILHEPRHCSDEVILTSDNRTTGTVATNSRGIDFRNDAVCTWNFYTSRDEGIGFTITSFDLGSFWNKVIVRDIDSSIAYETWRGGESNVVGQTFRSDAHRNVSLIFESSASGVGSGSEVRFSFYKTSCAESRSPSPVQMFKRKRYSTEGCAWLAEQDSSSIAFHCSNFNKVRRRCRVTCDSCQPFQRSCEDSVYATFAPFTFFTKSCEWLSRKTKTKKKRMCRLSQEVKNSCPWTCETCP